MTTLCIMLLFYSMLRAVLLMHKCALSYFTQNKFKKNSQWSNVFLSLFYKHFFIKCVSSDMLFVSLQFSWCMFCYVVICNHIYQLSVQKISMLQLPWFSFTFPCPVYYKNSAKFACLLNYWYTEIWLQNHRAEILFFFEYVRHERLYHWCPNKESQCWCVYFIHGTSLL